MDLGSEAADKIFNSLLTQVKSRRIKLVDYWNGLEIPLAYLIYDEDVAIETVVYHPNEIKVSGKLTKRMVRDDGSLKLIFKCDNKRLIHLEIYASHLQISSLDYICRMYFSGTAQKKYLMMVA